MKQLPVTEQANPQTRDIDLKPTLDIVRLINDEDKKVAPAISAVLDKVAEAVDLIVERLAAGGRLFYIGSGTSGRLGVLDASECPPTFGVQPDFVRGIIAGGYDALLHAAEGAEDDHEQGARDLQSFDFGPGDALVGLSAGGNTPYTLGAIEHANKIGGVTIGVSCNLDSRIAEVVRVAIIPIVGPEVIAGSTRMKAGTAQKLVLNMISSATMIKLGLVYGNLMSNLQAKNEKLRRRATEILAEETGLDAESALEAFKKAGNDLRIGLLMVKGGLERKQAEELLESYSGSVRRALDSLPPDA